MSKHTPGPWEIGACSNRHYRNKPPESYEGYQTSCTLRSKTGMARDRFVADIITDSRPEIGNANAFLLAAAPEMLEALLPFANYACDPPCGCHNCIARDVVAKAKGTPCDTTQKS